MRKPLDLTGERYGRLLVTEFAGVIKGQRYYYCECICGNETLSPQNHLRRGTIQSCGCSKIQHGGKRKGKATAEYSAWQHMRRSPDYVSSWDDFQQFFRDVGWRPDDTYELGRYDLTQPHGPENTYWRNPDEERERRINTDIGSELCIDMSTVRDTYAFSGTTDQA